MKGKENKEWTMSKHKNDYFKDEKIINDGKKKKKEMKLKYHALMISLSQTCPIKFSLNFSNTHFQETHDNEAESITIHINDPNIWLVMKTKLYTFTLIYIVIPFFFV